MRIGIALSALNKLTPIWKSNLDVSIKREFFRATVESVLSYSSQAWKLSKSLENELNGAYTCMLRAVLNVHWSQRVVNKKLYSDLPQITETIRYRRLKFSGDMMEKLRTTCFFGCPQMEKAKEEGHSKYILTNSLKTQHYK